MTDNELVSFALECNVIDRIQLLDSNHRRGEVVKQLQHFAAMVIEHERRQLHKELGTIAWQGEDIGWDAAIDAIRSHLASLYTEYDC